MDRHHEAGTVALRAPELENPCLGTIRIEEEDRGLPLHLYSYLGYRKLQFKSDLKCW